MAASSPPPALAQPAGPGSALMRQLSQDSTALTRDLVRCIERTLGRLPRLYIPAGYRLIAEGQRLKGVFVILSGRVALERRVGGAPLRLHHDSTGAAVGLLALARGAPAFFTARATTAVEAIYLTLDQLDRAAQEDSTLNATLGALATRALADRLCRSELLQIEKAQLNDSLERERQRLAETLHQLELARLELVAQARFATLGELAAGLAHELNNPIAAIMRAAAHLREDLEQLLVTHPAGPLAIRILARARERTTMSTAQERALVERMDAVLTDRQLAQRLLHAGITDPREVEPLLHRPADRQLLGHLADLGTALSNLGLAARQISELGTSLRGYARPVGESLDEVDLRQGLEETLTLIGHRLRGIEIERAYGPICPVSGRPGELNQVWTNLLLNAVEALAGQGRIRVETDCPDVWHSRVRIIDNGPGIDPSLLSKVFEPRFTTKQGTVQFGLGLGLAIANRIVRAHGGRIELSSVPGQTVASVVLPLSPLSRRDAQHQQTTAQD